MDPEVLRSYMIKLGVQVDTAAFDKMKKMLGDLESVMGKHASSTAMQATKGVGMIVGAYATLMISIGKLIKTTADADIQFQLLGQKMYMSTEAVKAFKQATDTLGHSVQEIAWNAELRSKYFVLVKDIQNLSVPEDAKDMMKQVRGIGFEFDRLKLASKLTLEQVAYNLMRINKGELTDIRTVFGNWVDKVYSKIPEMARKIAEFLQPFIQLGQSVIKFFKDMWESMKPTRDMINDIIGKLGEFYDKIPPIYKQILLLAGALGLIFAMGSPIMLAMGVFIGALALIDDYMQFKDGKESMNALVPIWIALDYVITKAATAMGFFAIAYSHFIAFMKGEKHESGKTFFQDISDYATFSDTRWKNKMWEIGEKRKATIEENKRIEAQEAAGMIPTGGVSTGVSKGGKQTRGVRNNNPGNLEYGDFSRKHGATGSDGRFAIFPTMEMGIKAQQALIFESMGGRSNRQEIPGHEKGYRDKNLREMIHAYAPKSDFNDTERYIAVVARGAGVNPTGKTMKDFSAEERFRISNTMFMHESRYSMAGSFKPQAGVVASAGKVTVGGGGGEPKSAPKTAEESSADFNKYMAQYSNVKKQFDAVTNISDKAISTADKAVSVASLYNEKAEKMHEKAKESKAFVDSKGRTWRGVSDVQELIPTDIEKNWAEKIRTSKVENKSTGRPPIWPMYLKEGEYRLPNAVEMARFGKYTTEAFIGSPLLAAAIGADKAMKKIQVGSDKVTKGALDTIMGKKLHQQYTMAAGRVSAAAGAAKDYGKGYGKKVVNQVSFVIHAGAANAEEVGAIIKKKYNEYTNKDKNKSGVRKGVLSK